ncbi:MAG: GAF domain-containing protein, partial [Pseudolysinimonas sp.]
APRGAQMLDSLRHVLVAPALGQWLRHSEMSWRLLETPQDAPVAHAPGPNADRIALIGSGVAVGYGVHLNDLAIGGQLARQISAATGRGTTLDTYAQIGMRALDCLAIVQSIDLTRFDAIVLTVGSDDALNLTPQRSFRGHIDTLLSWIAREAPSTLAVMVVAIPDIPTIMRLPFLFAGDVSRHCVRLNEQLRAACADHDGMRFLPFTPAGGDLMSAKPGTYRAWAALLAPSIARALDEQLGDPRRPALIHEARRQLALDELNILDSALDDRFTQIVTTARDLFGVDGASIIFVDGDRQWTMACAGMDPLDSPRGGALGEATVQNGKIFVVTDAQSDPRFAGHPWVTGPSKVAFFAGFPIEAANGQRIGALCLVDAAPRSFSPTDGSLLGELAQRVQTMLWGAVTGS